MLLRSLAFVPLLAVAAAHAEDPALTKIRKEVQAAMKVSPVPGLSLAIVKDGKVVFCEGFGYADVAKRKKATADTVYEIGSTTKGFTALLAAQAAQEGRLSLKDRPSKYLPGFHLKDKAADAKITIEDLLSHRSGLPRTDLAWYAGADFSRDDLLRLASQSEPTAPLGTRWQYQNLMVLFAGMIEEKVYGEHYEALLADRFFRPLGMAHSASTYAATRAEKELATGYSGRGAAYPLPLKEVDRIAPAGSVSSTARDMARYVQMLLAGGSYDGRQIVSKEAIDETRKPRIAMPGGAYGLGWMIGESHGAPAVFHGGNIDGYTAMVSLLPAQGLGVVALSNGNVASLPQQAVDIVYDALGPKEKADAAGGKLEEATDAELGDYHLAQPPVDLTFLREGKTVLMNQGGTKIPLKLVGPKRYTIQNAIFLTFGIGGKRVVKLEQSGMTFTLVPAVPFKAPMSAAELAAKALAAQGGADAIRRHARAVVRYHLAMPSDAIDVYGIRYRRDERSAAEYAVFYALNRRFADTLSAVDGTSSIQTTSFSVPTVETGPEAADALASANLEADIDPARFYQKVEIVREDRVGDVPVFVLEVGDAKGAKTLEFISKADFRVLRRETRKGPALSRADFSDFRNVDGETIPFRTTVTNQDGVKTIEEVLSVRYDERVPEWPFRLP